MARLGPGDFVKCVDARPGPWSECPYNLGLGEIYKVVSVRPAMTKAGKSAISVQVDRDSDDRWVWDPERFVPIYRPNTNLLRSLLQPIDA